MLSTLCCVYTVCLFVEEYAVLSLCSDICCVVTVEEDAVLCEEIGCVVAGVLQEMVFLSFFVVVALVVCGVGIGGC